MNNMNRKGQFAQVMTLMLIVAGAIVMLLFVTKFATRSTMEESTNACKLSVVTQSATAFGMVSKTSFLDINCDKRYVNLYNTKVEIGLSLENMNLVQVDYGNRKVKKFSRLNEFVVDQVVSEELHICKNEFGDGKIKIFPNDESGIFSDKNVCFVCSEITFEKTVDKQVFTKLLDYTKQTKFSSQGNAQSNTYYDYLTEQTVFNESMWEQATAKIDPAYNNLSIDTSKKYLVFVKKYSYSGTKNVALNALIPFRQYAIGEKKDSISVGVIPADDINKYCDIQAS
jgi:hypothetical protein